jgi:multimeric flavodoxin WrbA
VIASDVYAIVTPVTFGSLGSLAKRVQDRLICLILPYFKMIGGEIHHSARYRRYPALLVLGTQATANAEQAVLIARLVERNAVNLHCPTHGAAVVVGDGQARSEAEQLLDTIGVREEVAA